MFEVDETPKSLELRFYDLSQGHFTVSLADPAVVASIATAAEGFHVVEARRAPRQRAVTFRAFCPRRDMQRVLARSLRAVVARLAFGGDRIVIHARALP